VLARWLKYAFWRPFESFCHRFPLVPLRAHITEPVEGVRRISINNFVTRSIAKLGGYEYSICYLVDDSVLIDTGFPWARRVLRKVLIDLEAPSKLRFVINTHYHEDHTGNNGLVRELTGARVYAHADAALEIRFPTEKVWYRRFLFGPSPATEIEVAPAQVATGRRDLQIHHFPGHCPGHVCVFEPSRRLLFSGDLYISADLDSQLADADGPAWIASLERALALEPEALLDGHGVVVQGREAVTELLLAKLAFLRELRRRIHTAAAAGARTVQQITREVFGSKGVTNRLSFSDGWLSLLTGADFSRGNLVRTFLRELYALPAGEESRAQKAL
jgi:glyoxylase-like metal-dependent hydrolase (beta-lactamase superfamily II)